MGRLVAVVKRFPMLPGLLGFAGLYAVLAWRGVPFKYDWEGSLWLLEDDYLRDDLLTNIWFMHSQPPLLSIMRGLLLPLGSSQALAWQLIIFVCGLLTVALISATVSTLTRSWKLAALAGITYALVPSTIAYAFQAKDKNTITQFLFALLAWGFAELLARRRADSSQAKVIVWSVAAFGGLVSLALLRASITWIIVFPIAIVALVLARKVLPKSQRPFVTVISLVFLGVLAILQVKNFAYFGSASLSSWGPTNLMKGLVYSNSVNPATLAQLRNRSECHEWMLTLNGYFDEQLPAFCPEPSPTLITPPDIPLMTDELAPEPNRNNVLVAQNHRARTSYVLELVRADPVAPVRMLLGTRNADMGSLYFFFKPGEDYAEVVFVQQYLGPYFNFMSHFTQALGPLAFILISGTLTATVISRSMRVWVPPAYWLLSALFVYHSAVSLLIDHGENDRFRTEASSLWIVLAFFSVSVLIQFARKSAPKDTRVPTTTSG